MAAETALKRTRTARRRRAADRTAREDEELRRDTRPAEPPHTYLREMNRGRELRRAQRHQGAAEAFLAAAQLARSGSKERDALFLRAMSLKDADRPDLAEDAFRSLLRNHPSDAIGWALYGTFLRGLGRYADAIEALKRSLEIVDDIPTRNALVVALYKADRLEEAIIEGRRCLEQKDARALAQFGGSAGLSSLPAAGCLFNPRTPRRNIIAFSLWGDDPAYVHGAIVNAQIAPHIYYGWTLRFYCDRSVPVDAVAELQRLGSQVVFLDDPAMQTIRPMWRFLVSDDLEVDWFLCRDADSRLNCQELVAVEEWLRSGRPFHVMRDHIYHMDLILAGMWGGRAGLLPNMKQALLSSPQYSNNRFGDQNFLMEKIWPLIRDQTLIHDTYYRFPNGKEFPSAYRLPRPLHVGGAVKRMPNKFAVNTKEPID